MAEHERYKQREQSEQGPEAAAPAPPQSEAELLAYWLPRIFSMSKENRELLKDIRGRLPAPDDGGDSGETRGGPEG